MKKFKRLLTLTFAIALVFSLAATAFAAGDTQHTITINNDASGYTYVAYQIFTGDLFEGKLSNIVWGNGISESGKEALLSFQDESYDSAAKLAEALTDEDAFSFANEAAKYLVEGNAVESKFVAATATASAYYKIENLPSGFYLIANSAVAENGAYTNYILEVVGDSNIEHKHSVPSVIKKVKDVNDSTGVTSDWQDSADFDIGDTVKFRLTATLADNVSTYHWYKLAFLDNIDPGLTLVENSYKVYLDECTEDNDITSAFSLTKPATGDYNFIISCNDVKASPVNATNNSLIIVEYDAILNENAQTGIIGNDNKLVLEYANNPYWVPQGFDEANPPATPPQNPPVGRTPRDDVAVFTYQINVNKVDDNDEPLAGATFDLYKKELNPDYDANIEDSEQFIWVNKASAEAVAVYSEEEPETVVSYTATFKGVDDGEYLVRESVTPGGYNTCDDVTFTITAEHDVLSADPSLTLLSAGDLTEDMQTGIVSTTIINKAGALLPETGGIGTTIFYVVGGLMVLCSVVFLIAKKRTA